MIIDDSIFSFFIKKLSATSFNENFLMANNLQGSEFKKWLFYPGMLFDSDRKWWGDWRFRASKHEGLDLAFYQDDRLKVQQIPPISKVPAAYSGIVQTIIKDFLGWTIFLKHPQFSQSDNIFCSVYAHLKLSDQLKTNLEIKEGEILGATVTSGTKIKLTPHVHLSLGWFKKDILPEISWEKLNCRENMRLIDPLEVWDLSYDFLENKPLK